MARHGAPGLVPAQKASPSGVADSVALPVRDPGPGSRTGTTFPEMYAVGLRASACTHPRWVPGSLLGPASRPSTKGEIVDAALVLWMGRWGAERREER